MKLRQKSVTWKMLRNADALKSSRTKLDNIFPIRNVLVDGLYFLYTLDHNSVD